MALIKTIAAGPGEEIQHVEMTADEESEFISQRQAAVQVQAIQDLKLSAQLALDKSDLVALRCLKSGVTFPSEWQSYVSELRSIINSGVGPLPDQPAYPAGT